MTPLIRFFDAARKDHLYLFGQTEVTQQLIGMLGSLGLNRPRVFDSKSVDRELQSDHLVVNCVVAGRPLLAQATLQALGFGNSISYFDLYRDDHRTFPLPFCTDSALDHQLHREHYHWLRAELADAESVETLDQLLRLRVDGVPGGQHLNFRLADQYWDTLDLSGRRSFFDGGAFDGRNSLDFMKRQADWEYLWMIEPMPEPAERLRRHFVDRKIEVLQCALGAQPGSTGMTDCGTQSRIGMGDVVVDVRTIDGIVANRRVGYLKLDIEGAEPDALLGARQTIMRDQPALAICVYHQQSHFWKVPRIVRSFNPNYRILLRHYTEGIFETVMYFY